MDSEDVRRSMRAVIIYEVYLVEERQLINICLSFVFYFFLFCLHDLHLHYLQHSYLNLLIYLLYTINTLLIPTYTLLTLINV